MATEEKASYAYKQALFEMGDEQTVNSCLVALLIPVAWILGHSRCIHLDRKPLQLRSRDGNIIYEARVDGVITDSKGSAAKSIMEVKRGLRGSKTDVRMQEGAQMAAFIYSDQTVLGKGKEKQVFHSVLLSTTLTPYATVRSGWFQWAATKVILASQVMMMAM